MQSYLHDTTLDRLLRCCERVLLEKQLELLHGEFPALLRDHKHSDLARMFKLASRIPDGLSEMRTLLEQHISQQGQDAVLKKFEEASNVCSGNDVIDDDASVKCLGFLSRVLPLSRAKPVVYITHIT